MTDAEHRAAARAASQEAARSVGERARADLDRLLARPELMAAARETVDRSRARRALLAETMAEQDAGAPSATWRRALG